MFQKINKLFFCLAIILCVSCDEKRFYDEYKSLDSKWERKNQIRFSFEQKDTVHLYNLFVNVRNNNTYPFNNIFLIVKLKQPDNVIKVDTLEYLMADVDGTLLGEGTTDLKHSKLWYKENFKFPKAGKFEVTIEQANREIGKIKGVEVLDGITEIGFRIEKK